MQVKLFQRNQFLISWINCFLNNVKLINIDLFYTKEDASIEALKEEAGGSRVEVILNLC